MWSTAAEQVPDPLNAAMYGQVASQGTYVRGGCEAWQAFVGGPLLQDLVRPTTSISIFSLANLSATPTVVECVGQGSSTLSGLLAGLDPRDRTLSCLDAANVTHSWSVTSPTGGCGGTASSLCVDCANTSLACGSQCAHDHSIVLCRGACVPSDHARILVVSYVPYAAAPNVTVHMDSVSVSRTGLLVNVSLDDDGTLYCHAVAAVSGGGTPPSVDDIMLADHKAVLTHTSSSSGPFPMRIPKLTPDTEYSLYCLSVSVDGAVTDTGRVVSSAVPFTTPCCRTVTATLWGKTQRLATGQDGAIQLEFDAAPTQPLRLYVFALDVDGVRLRSAFSPDTIHVPSTTTTDATTLVFNVAWTGAVRDESALGRYNITIVAIEVETAGTAHDISIVFDQGRTFAVVADSVEPPTPVLVEAVFAYDATHVLVGFDSPTDRNGSTLSSSPFPCADLFEFESANLSRCVWVDSANIRLYPGEGSTLAVGEPIILRGGILKAACAASASASAGASGCATATWAHLASSSVVLTPPSTPQLPIASLSGPSLVGAGPCVDVIVDVSSSTGSGGRPWQSVRFTVTSAAPNATLMEGFLNYHYVESPPTAIPHQLLQPGFKYHISVILCNFLGGCGQSNRKTISVVNSEAPTSSILGASLRTVAKKDPVVVNSAAYIAACADGGGVTKSYDNLVYSWSVSAGGVQLFSLISSSVDRTKFYLPGFSLSTGRMYVVNLSVLDTTTRRASASFIQIFVRTGSVVAAIRGGTVQSVQRGSELELDASASYDEDVGFLSSGAASADNPSLQFAWLCRRTAPTFTTSCGVGIVGGTSDPVLVVRATAAEPTTSIIVVTVTEGSIADSGSTDPLRSAQATVTVQATADGTPIVVIDASPSQSGKVNVNQHLRLSGSVTAGQNGSAAWGVSDPSIPLTDAAGLLTPLNSTFMAPVGGAKAVIPMFFSLAAHTLPERAVLTFTLTCTLVSGVVGLASVVVTTNGAPLAGVFAVSPASGLVFNTSFQFAASAWTDEDPPLLYAFSFVDGSSGTRMTVQSASEAPYGESVLPPGTAAVGSTMHMVTCSVAVFDALSAVATAERQVQVTEWKGGSTTLAVTIAAQLDAGAGNMEVTRQVLVTGASVLNTVNCSAAPDCVILSRRVCSQTPHTCGPCLSGYVGDEGDANSRCVPTSAVFSWTMSGSSSNTDVNANANVTEQSCSSTNDCDIWSTCSGDGQCQRLLKQCIDPDCSGHGACSFVNNLDGYVLVGGICRQGNSTCSAVCSCVDGFVGGDCSATAAEMAAKQQIRALLIASLGNLTQSEIPSGDNLVSWSNSLSALTQISEEVPRVSLDSIGAIVTTIVQRTASSSDTVAAAEISGVVGALDIITQSLAKGDVSTVGQRRQLATGGVGVISVSTVVGLLTDYISLVSREMLPGQSPIESIKANFRLSSTAISGGGGGGDGADDGSMLVTPRTFAEIVGNTPAMEVMLPSGIVSDGANAGSDVIEVNSVVMDAELFNSSAFFSNPMFITMSRSPCVSGVGVIAVAGSCRMNVTLRNNIAVPMDSTDYS